MRLLGWIARQRQSENRIFLVLAVLIGALADPCERVRIAAVHARAWARWKTDAGRPAPVTPLSLETDEDRRVNALAPRRREQALGDRARASFDCVR